MKEEKEWGFGLPGVRRGREAVRDSDWMVESKLHFKELLSKDEQEFGILGTIIQWVYSLHRGSLRRSLLLIFSFSLHLRISELTKPWFWVFRVWGPVQPAFYPN
ncbi:hypothetical protein L195_g000230 [Trifolium pratense]|uniref:Uncharacterized protein n=1 Tax=Trifolium pratense TaxID=57577 RepID=A0A2K3NLB5_TRIPR|nr:hypothetical protein L195_g054534 [Trifolium pratense]PNY03820.1 hypothetical protein L195_g000230 [Trifolium pratense]